MSMDAPFVAFGVAIDQCWGMDKLLVRLFAQSELSA
jgi:hypothetical protein